MNCNVNETIQGIKIRNNRGYDTIRITDGKLNSVILDNDTILPAKESYDNNKLSEQDLEQYKSLLSIKDLELLNLDEQNQKLQAQISILKDIKLNSMEEKLNKTIDMLNNMQDYLVENRIIARRTSKLIDGRDITDEELAAERLKLEAIKNGK